MNLHQLLSVKSTAIVEQIFLIDYLELLWQMLTIYISNGFGEHLPQIWKSNTIKKICATIR